MLRRIHCEQLEQRLLLVGDVVEVANVRLTTELVWSGALPREVGEGKGHVHDFNNDGYLDLFVESGRNLYLGKSDGSFEDTPTFQAGGYLYGLHDINKDGKLDIVTGSRGTVYVWLNTSDAKEFSVEFIELIVPADLGEDWIGQIDLIDLDNDGLDDIVAEGTHHRFYALHNGSDSGEIHFELRPGTIIGRPTYSDTNRDGLVDIVSVKNQLSSSELRIYENEAEAGLALNRSFVFQSRDGEFLGAVDVSGDGVPDLVERLLRDDFESASENCEPHLLRDGDCPLMRAWYWDDGSYERTELFRDPLELYEPRTFGRRTPHEGVGDFDGDFIPDRITQLQQFDGLYTYLVHLSSNEFVASYEIDIPNCFAYYSGSPQLADVTGDGHADFVVASVFSTHTPTFDAMTLFPGSENGIPREGITFDDGFLLYVNPKEQTVATHDGVGAGTTSHTMEVFRFVEPRLFSNTLRRSSQAQTDAAFSLFQKGTANAEAFEFSTSIALELTDGPNVVDISIAKTGDFVSVVGNDVFKHNLPFTVHGVVQADISGDGIDDVIVWSGTKYWRSWFREEGAERSRYAQVVTFLSDDEYRRPTIYDLGLKSVTAVAATDVDQDGDVDLLLESEQGPFLWANRGDISVLDLNEDGYVMADDAILACAMSLEHGNSTQASAVDTLANLGFLMGDSDLDGRVSFVDFLALANNFGSNDASWSQGDFNCDGVVDFDDFRIQAENFGASSRDGVSEVSSSTL